MSKASRYAESEVRYNDQHDAVTALQADVKSLNATVEKFQNTSGAITQEDEKLLAAIEKLGLAIADKLATLSTP